MSSVHLEVGDDLEDNQKLWRYMDLPKLVSMISKSSLWLARADTFKDKQEGRFPDEMTAVIKKAYESFDDSDPSPVKDADDFQDYLRKNTFVNCWHKNFDENMIMWEIYGQNNNAVAVQTDIESFKVNLKTTDIIGHSLILKDVIYKGLGEIQEVLPYEDCFFIKRPHFHFEEEVRLSLDTYDRCNPTKSTPYGYNIPINLNGFIQTIMVHPDSPDWFVDAIESIMTKYEIHTDVVKGSYGNN